MTDFLYFLLTMAVAAAGAWGLNKLKIPAGRMMGAMFAAMAFNLLTERGVCYAEVRTIVQILSGALIGQKFSRANVRAMKKLIVPIIILNVMVVVMNLVCGFSIYRFSHLDLATSLFAASPGGASDMALISSELGANTTYVTLLQLTRQLTIFICMPPIFKRLILRDGANKKSEIESHETQKAVLPRKTMLARTGITLAVGAAFGLLFKYLGVAAGAMVGSMLAVVAFNLITGKAHYPLTLRKFTQVFSGAYIGLRIDRASLLSMQDIIVPMLILIAAVFVFSTIIALLIVKFSDMKPSVALMSATPGGLQEISLLADELGVDASSVALMQTTRLMFVMAAFPSMLTLLSGFDIGK